MSKPMKTFNLQITTTTASRTANNNNSNPPNVAEQDRWAHQSTRKDVGMTVGGVRERMNGIITMMKLTGAIDYGAIHGFLQWLQHVG